MFQSQNNPNPTTPAPALTTMQRIPTNVALPLTPPALQKTSKAGLPKPVPSPVVVVIKPPEGFVAPALEKVTKAPHKAPDASVLRASWPDVNPNATKVVTPQAVGMKVEDPNGLYIITCDVKAMGVNSDDATKGRRIIHGIYSYARMMTLDGKDTTDRLINLALKMIPLTVPPFVKTGLAMGTIGLKVNYPVTNSDIDLVATIEINSSIDETIRYRTINVRRFTPNMITSLDL